MLAMRRLMAGRTTFMIAHRLSTLSGCNMRLELRGGKLHPSGACTTEPISGRGRRMARVIVTGLIAQHRNMGGVAWDYLNFLIGLRSLGHDVFYVEELGGMALSGRGAFRRGLDRLGPFGARSIPCSSDGRVRPQGAVVVFLSDRASVGMACLT